MDENNLQNSCNDSLESSRKEKINSRTPSKNFSQNSLESNRKEKVNSRTPSKNCSQKEYSKILVDNDDDQDEDFETMPLLTIRTPHKQTNTPIKQPLETENIANKSPRNVLLNAKSKDQIQKRDKIFAAETIVKMRVRKGHVEYYVKWKDYPSSANTWEPEKNILDDRLIEEYKNRLVDQVSKESNIEEITEYNKNCSVNMDDLSSNPITPNKRFIPMSLIMAREVAYFKGNVKKVFLLFSNS